MIKVQPNTEVAGELVTKIIKKYKSAYLPRLETLEKYYQVENDILKRTMQSEKPNNKMAHGFAKYITNMATGYFMGEGVRYEAKEQQYQQDLDNLLDKNYTKDSNFEVAKEMSKKGIAFELLYINETSELKFKEFQDMIPVYSTSAGEFLEFAIRIWDEEDLLSGKTISFAEVYTKAEIITYRKEKDTNEYIEITRTEHYFEDVPVIVYWNNKEQKGDYEDVITLIDAYDKTQSDTANDFEYFTDAYLVLIGAGELVKEGEAGDEKSAAKTLKQERILLLDEKGQAEWLIKQINDTAVENFKNRVYDDIFFLSQVPALTDESFAGNLSGVAIRYKLIGLEQLAVIKENKFLAAQKKKIKLITQFLNKKRNKNYNPDEVQIIFDRNMIENLEEAAKTAAELEGIVSKETQLRVLPIVKNVQEEIARIKKEKEEEDNLGNIDEETLAALAGEDNV